LTTVSFAKILVLLGAVFHLTACNMLNQPEQTVMNERDAMPKGVQGIKFATFNVSMEATNYLGRETKNASSEELATRLAQGNDPQIRNIAEIIQRVAPDVILLNEFDYIEDPKRGIQSFLKNYLNVSQGGATAIDYPYFYYSTVNTGEPSPFDLDRDGHASGVKGDAYGFGYFPGHYGMVVLSKYPIKEDMIRTFQYFKWSDMPGALQPGTETEGLWYSDEEWQDLRLSSKSHWDLPLEIDGQTVHLLASHPTPPVFDGPEDRNGKRNHDEIRFWKDYLSNEKYIYDDAKNYGGLEKDASFVIVGDLNASALEGAARRDGIASLLNHTSVNAQNPPASLGGKANKPKNSNAKHHTAAWGMRADYVLPSHAGLKLKNQGVFWPEAGDSLHHLVSERSTSSDHKLVWIELGLRP
jgi:endonuclease/exonuclease/phosphatase family metal-dependent hydrolase